MPNDITRRVYNGEDVSLKEFAFKCFEYMRALEKVDLERTHREMIAEAEENIRALQKMTVEEAEAKMREMLDEQERYIRHPLDKEMQKKASYGDMLSKVSAWTPPTYDHDNSKNFMIKQLEDLIRSDFDTDYIEISLDRVRKERESVDGDKFIRDQIENEEEVIGIHRGWLKNLIETDDVLSDWTTQLEPSFPDED